jgi:hypothetical protein
MLLIMPGSVTVNISHFDCDVLSSNLSLVTKNVGFSLSVKRLSVQQGNRVRAPESTNTVGRLAYSSTEECCASNAVMKVRIFLSQLVK